MASMMAEPKPKLKLAPRPRTPDARQTAAQPPAERLSKRVAGAVPCSRREAEQYIEGGWVSVDGTVVEEPMFRVSTQKVSVDPDASLLELLPVTLLLLHKPPGYDALAALGEANRQVKPAQQLLQWLTTQQTTPPHLPAENGTLPNSPPPCRWRQVPVVWWSIRKTGACGRRKLTEDAGVMEQEIIVEVAGEVPPESLQRINHMQSADGRPLPPVKVSLNSTGEKSSKLRFALKGVVPV